MTPDELRALADALEPMARAPRFEDFDVPAFCAWVRACADAQPVAWMHDGFMSTDYERVQHDEMRNRSCGFKAKPIIPLYAHLAPAAPQAEPCIGNDPACPCQDGDACHYKDGADGTKAWSVPQAELKREPVTARRILEIEDDASRQWRDNGRIIEYVVVFARMIERAHGTGGTDPALDDLQAKERA